MLALSECVVVLPSQKAPQNSNSISNGTLPLSRLGWEQRVGEMAKRALVKSGLFGEGDRSGVLDYLLLLKPQERHLAPEWEALLSQLFEVGPSSAIPEKKNPPPTTKRTNSNTMKDIKVNREGHYGGINCLG